MKTLPDFEFIIPWNNQLHNFEFGDGELNVVWRAYGIVSGKRFVVDKNTDQSLYVCYFMILER